MRAFEVHANSSKYETKLSALIRERPLRRIPDTKGVLETHKTHHHNGTRTRSHWQCYCQTTVPYWMAYTNRPTCTTLRSTRVYFNGGLSAAMGRRAWFLQVCCAKPCVTQTHERKPYSGSLCCLLTVAHWPSAFALRELLGCLSSTSISIRLKSIVFFLFRWYSTLQWRKLFKCCRFFFFLYRSFTPFFILTIILCTIRQQRELHPSNDTKRNFKYRRKYNFVLFVIVRIFHQENQFVRMEPPHVGIRLREKVIRRPIRVINGPLVIAAKSAYRYVFLHTRESNIHFTH